jgi:hypothetical protein
MCNNYYEKYIYYVLFILFGANRNPFNTLAEWESEYKTLQGISMTSLLVVVTVICLLFNNKNWKKSYLAISYSLMVLLSAIFYVAICWQESPQVAFCSNNANGMSFKDGYTICNFQAIVTSYVSLGCTISFMFQGLELYQKVFYPNQSHIKDNKRVYFHMMIIHLYPLVPVMYIISSGMYGFDGKILICGSVANVSTFNRNMKYLLVYLPAAISEKYLCIKSATNVCKC